MAAQIKFGTSGWRAVVAEDFTFANVRRSVSGIARYVVSQKPAGSRVIVGRDPRFLGETFCAIAADVLAAHGITPLVIAEAAPTPTIAYAVIREHADGAINFTASHNPPEYNGIKFSTPDGAPALPEVTRKIEAEIAADSEEPLPKTQIKQQALDPRATYLVRLKEIIDLNIIRKAGLRVAVDPLWGAARGYSDSLLREAGVEVASVHDYRDVLFGGHAPEPDDHLLNDLRAKMEETKAHIGIATDGDGDRFGIVDADGKVAAGRTAWPNLWPPPTSSTHWPSTTRSNCTKRPWASSTLASSSSKTKSPSAGKRARDFPSAITFRKKTACLPDSCAARL